MIGGQQDRVIGEEIIVEATGKPTLIRVYCVEHGRWSQRDVAQNADYLTTVVASQGEKLSPDEAQKLAEAANRGQFVKGAGVVTKDVRVAVFAKGEKEKEARDAGADHVGAEDLADKIQKEGWIDFDVVVATPDIMGLVGRLGKVLGPRGLMPNPKTGTVTFDIAKAIRDIRAGKVEYRVEKAGIVHVPVGKASFDEKKLFENARTVLESTLTKLFPSAVASSW